MGSSLKDILKAAMLKAERRFSSQETSSEKKRQSPIKINTIEPAGEDSSAHQESPQIENKSFFYQMQEMGVEPANFQQTRSYDDRREKNPDLSTFVRNNSISENELKKIGQRLSKLNREGFWKKDIKHSPKTKSLKKQLEPKGEKTPEKILIPKSNNQQVTQKRIQSTPTPEPYTIEVTGRITPHPILVEAPRLNNPILPKNNGIMEQVATKGIDDEREVVIGLDFGTSCVKVVIGDNALGEAFTVPFSEEFGLPSYLLPSRVWLDGNKYALYEQGKAQRNLKLRLIDANCSLEPFADATAFLALVIRHSRGWLFSQHADTYKRTEILWKLNLGLPAASYSQKNLVDRFKKLAGSAWLVAGFNGDVSRETTERICQEAQDKIFEEFWQKPELRDIDFDVVPEISAQIYGFLTSTKFDPQARNIFMIVDVGAGTVDSSIFHATRGRGKKFSFQFFSNSVEFNGVSNLHAARIKWLKKAFTGKADLADLTPNLEAIEYPTDRLNGIPENIGKYFEGLDITFNVIDKNPDNIFFENRLKRQVLAKTFKDARRFVSSEHEFRGIPLFISGGGSRMKFYKKLEYDLLHHPNASWFNFDPRKLEIPDILSAPGLQKIDFDRLSVAFGLSFPNVGQNVPGRLAPPQKPRTRDYSDRFIDKDMV